MMETKIRHIYIKLVFCWEYMTVGLMLYREGFTFCLPFMSLRVTFGSESTTPTPLWQMGMMVMDVEDEEKWSVYLSSHFVVGIDYIRGGVIEGDNPDEWVIALGPFAIFIPMRL